MRKWVVALLIAARTATVAACGGNSDSSGSSASGKKSFKMTLITGVKGDEFYETMNCGAQAEAKANSVSLDLQAPDQFDPSLQTPIVNAALAKNPDLKGIFAANVFSGEGAATALKQAVKLGQVKIVGFDATPKQVHDLKSGLVQALVTQEPATIGKDGVEQALDALTGKPTTKEIGTDFKVITKANLAQSQGSLYKASC